jgi:aminoglycoside phosphotransferase (APT) family kinase protein
MSVASANHLPVDEAIVLNDSNRLVLRLMPCDVVVRVARIGHQGSAQKEVELARRLAEIDSPVAAPDPRVAPRAFERDGFIMNMWTYHEPVASPELAPGDYLHALGRLHAGMRKIDLTAPHFMERIADTQNDVANRDITPDLSGADRELLASTLQRLRRSIGGRRAVAQLLHGEPHPWNILCTHDGPLFIDFENAARGPVEYDLAWVPEEVSKRYPGADQELVGECRGLMLAIVATWRWRRDDEHPSGPQRAAWLNAFREGPPWPAVDDV